jgi:hypothetical protein
MADGGFNGFRSEWVSPASQAEACPVCPSLPSSDTAYALLRGQPAAVPYLLRDLAGRAVLVGTGIYFVDRWLGEASVKNAALRGLGGAVMIELCVIAYVAVTTRGRR